MTADAPVYFFVHIMKTGGTSLLWMLYRSVFGTDDAYPGLQPKGDISYLLNPYGGFANGKIEPRSLVAGHFPIWVRDALDTLDRPVRTFCLFREPVERAASHLRHAQRAHGGSLESVYADKTIRETRLHNLMTRQLGALKDPSATTLFDLPSPTDEDLQRALAALSTLDVVGTTEDMDGMVRRLNERFGWSLQAGEPMNVGKGARIPDWITEELYENNALDRALYARVLTLCASADQRSPPRQPSR